MKTWQQKPGIWRKSREQEDPLGGYVLYRLFIGRRRKPSASVFVNTHGGSSVYAVSVGGHVVHDGLATRGGALTHVQQVLREREGWTGAFVVSPSNRALIAK